MIGQIKNWFGKTVNAKPRKCDYNSVEECPYNSTSQCKFDKSSCHLANSQKKRQKYYNSSLRIIIFALSGLVVYILVSIASIDESYAFKYSKYIYSIISGIAISVMTGSILAIMIDIPSRLKEYELSFVKALSSNNYLKSLDESHLTRLRNDITEQLHKTKAPSMAKGLIEIDQRVCELLRQPYYSRYRHTVVCSIIGESDYIQKEHTIEYKLINPYSVNQTAVEFIKFTNLILVKDGQPEAEAITNLSINCSIDNKPEIDLSSRIKFEYQDITEEFYNKKITISDRDGTDSPGRGLRVEFDDNIKVRMKYKIEVHKTDPCFTKRLQHPAKNFRLDYTCNDSSIELFGQIFGTEIKQSDISIKYPSNSISLETFDWLLPDNGAIVIMLKKDK
ncbi:hypothetical protein HDR66_00490 [bacterium]|nr:hypothetical protein [bacterium]